MPRQLQGVGRHPRLQTAAHFRRRPEVTVGRHQAVDALVRALEVVVVDEQSDPALGIAHVDEDRALDALAPERAPEAFDLAERLRVAWPGHDLLDAAFFQLLGERALAAPGHVLRAVVGEDLLRRAVRREADAQHLQHQRGRLTGVQAVARDESAVVIHERDEVDTPVLTLEDEREQVGLPELVGRGAFEVTHLVRVRMGRHFLEHVTGLVQDRGDRTGAGWQGGTTQQHVADLLATPVRVGLLEHQDAALGQVGQPAATRRPARLVHQPGRPVGVEAFLPAVQRVLRHADQAGEVAGRQPAAQPGVEQQQALLGGQRHGPLLQEWHEPSSRFATSTSRQARQSRRERPIGYVLALVGIDVRLRIDVGLVHIELAGIQAGPAG